MPDNRVTAIRVQSERDGHSRGMTDIRLWITDYNDGLNDDLAKGAGGKYRYLLPEENIENEYITEVALWRGKLDSAPYGWKWAYDPGVAADINSGRGGDYLYLVYKGDPNLGQR
ncbi:hypothetical protein TWF281_011235 [Arthrobotrys megalospora]